MKKIIAIILLVLIIPITYAESLTLDNVNDISVNTKISSGLNLDYNQGYSIEYIFANLTFFPKEEILQSITNQDVNPNPEEISNNNILFKWTHPNEEELNFKVETNINSYFKFPKVRSKVNFPFQSNPNFEKYLSETETIKPNNPLIIEKANELAQGEDDLFVVTHKIGNWVKGNINYSLETLTAEVSQDAVWVLENEIGVCDELTVLFISMLRSLNVPARFSSGIAYTNVIDDYGNHAWAEVYFPEYGWIPFDVTYGQMGYVDASHIKMKDSIGAKDVSIKYGWKSRNVDVTTDSIKLETITTNIGSPIPKYLDINIELLNNNVGSGSYVPIKVEITNNNNFYVPTTLIITKAPQHLETNTQEVLIKPQETKNTFFIIPIPNKAQQGYIYTSIIEVKDNFGSLDFDELIYSEGNEIYTLEDAQNKISELTESEEKEYSSDLNVECASSKSQYYEYETVDVSCSLFNNGNTNLDNLNICLNGYCKNIDIRIAETKEINLNTKVENEDKEIKVKVENDEVTKYEYLNAKLLKDPNIEILNLNFPDIISYSEEGEISLLLRTNSTIKNILVEINNKDLFNIPFLENQEQLTIPFKGNFFYHNDPANLKVVYEDLNDKKYETNQKLNVRVTNIPWYAKLDWLWFSILGLVIIFLLLVLIKKFSKT
ncbi:transglutaminase domain-containing protein [archaeon]|nr:transglutaminase domain-containing protein [archaeon]